MIDTQAIRSKILDLAIRGQLTEQLPEDGTAEKLYQQIQEEKAVLIKTGIIKKEKQLPRIQAEEVPFSLPESWKWVYLGELFQHNTGKALNASDRRGRCWIILQPQTSIGIALSLMILNRCLLQKAK